MHTSMTPAVVLVRGSSPTIAAHVLQSFDARFMVVDSKAAHEVLNQLGDEFDVGYHQ